MASQAHPLIDPFGRAISYLRISVTDRCDLRCVYCMQEHMTFLPREELLTFEELERLGRLFIRLGTTKLRITGGEPLVRRDVMQLIASLGQDIGQDGAMGGLQELTLTTNGSQLARHAAALVHAGMRRINVSLDTLNPDRFRTITRGGRLEQTLDGLLAAKAAGLHIKINTVALRGLNEDEIDDLIAWCGMQGFDLCLIETMPLGETGENRLDQYLPLSVLRPKLERRWTLTRELKPETAVTGIAPGPARYWRIAETGGRIGFITPLTEHFCDSCNRVRLTCTGTLFMCLGQEDQADLRTPLRAGASDQDMEMLVRDAIARKPHKHDFMIAPDAPQKQLTRHMSVTGG
ncbi:GTP 3',8-cyclase MoaA [Acidisoma cellulosilytica]|uniref:GTP 3',8-cyclase n=1 Tax=Acidisoma cellulosilyticum TaxID=2802395 RepID=A0A964E3U6_9PROT|nr:GTP 3',8-cyclase MoaA [Acidisoma cellulosilyticum]MCB8880799.1 GTP 3',8-cyclase MoaA [Acidisoma cellulosilyticum]